MKRVSEAIVLFTLLCTAGLARAATFYIAATGSDAQAGTSKMSPWQHAPGMPSCTGTCGAYAPVPGDQFIFRGGDTWHFGNAAATPYVGGTWTWSWDGTAGSCDTSDDPNATRTGCVYVGVDQTWFSGSGWTRPVMTGDNPASTTPVSSCAYGNVGSSNQFLVVANNAFAWFDDFEWTGMCQQTAATQSNDFLFDWNLYIGDQGGSRVIRQNIYSNHYAHGWTHLPFSCDDFERGAGRAVLLVGLHHRRWNEHPRSGQRLRRLGLGPHRCGLHPLRPLLPRVRQRLRPHVADRRQRLPRLARQPVVRILPNRRRRGARKQLRGQQRRAAERRGRKPRAQRALQRLGTTT